jgi:hypothetical protein
MPPADGTPAAKQKETVMNDILEREFGSRLVGLRNGARGLREGLNVRTSVPSDAGSEPVVDFISSDESLDRYNEIISANGWVLDTYLKNPVFQDSHDYSTILRTIGKATVTQVRDGKLFQRIVFAVNANPLAKIAYALYKGGFLNAVSVGFVPVKWQNGDGSTGFARKYTQQILLETSAVAFPANPNALQLAYDAGAVEKRDLRELLKLLNDVASETRHSSLASQHFPPAAPGSNTRALGTASDEAHEVMNLMRQVSALCRKA